MPVIVEDSQVASSTFSVRSLMKIAVRKLALCLDMHGENLHSLPEHLKTEVLEVATKGGKLGNEVLKSLLHAGILQLDLRGCPVCDETLENISICRRLQKLILNSGHAFLVDVTASALKCMFPNFPKLTTLCISYCDGVSDDVVYTLAKSCSLLAELDISGCSTITDLSLRHLKDLENLNSLNISNTNITDRGVLSLVRGCCSESLRELKIADCEGITDLAIETIVLYCSNMKVLIFHGCPVTGMSWITLHDLFLKSKVKNMTWTVY